MIKKLFILSSLLIFQLLLFGQSSISGTITDNRKRPISNASISIADSYDGATTDSLGRFRFVTTLSGEIVLQISSINYLPTEEKINIKLKEDLIVNISLKEKGKSSTIPMRPDKVSVIFFTK